MPSPLPSQLHHPISFDNPAYVLAERAGMLPTLATFDPTTTHRHDFTPQHGGRQGRRGRRDEPMAYRPFAGGTTYNRSVITIDWDL